MKLEEFRNNYPKTTYRLAITMAGAVSAGAYSAGAMCYLLQNLEEWEKLKKQNYQILFDCAQKLNKEQGGEMNLEWVKAHQSDIELKAKKTTGKAYHPIPMHDVIIEAIGGASAGSLVAAIAVLSFTRRSKPIDADSLLSYDGKNYPNEGLPIKDFGADEDLSHNLMFDSWVNLRTGTEGKGPHRTPFSKLLEVDQARELQQPFALLKADLLDQVKQYQLNKAFNEYEKIDLPAYISSKLKVYFSITSLKGAEFGIRFRRKNMQQEQSKNENPIHYMRIHSGMAIYQLNSQPGEKGVLPLNVNDEDYASAFIDSAIASGAFPIGLPPRRVELSRNFIHGYLESVLTANLNLIEIREQSDPFVMPVIDGGTLNNEPFTEVWKHVNQNYGDKENEHPVLILIDPFPNFKEKNAEEKKEEKDTYPKSLMSIIWGIIGAIRGQAMVKDPGELSVADGNIDPGPAMIFPSRKDKARNSVEDAPALATGAIDGFAGFLDAKFRAHDFHLGMKNCQSFIRQYFHIDADDAHERLSFADYGPGDERYETFGLKKGDKVILPLIPDMKLLHVRKRCEEDLMQVDEIKVAKFPTIQRERIRAYQPEIYSRVRFLAARLRRSMGSAPKPKSKGLGVTRNKVIKWCCLGLLLLILLLLFFQLPAVVFWAIVFLLLLAGYSVYHLALASLTEMALSNIETELRKSKQLIEDEE